MELKKVSAAIDSKYCTGPEHSNEEEIQCRVMAQTAETISKRSRECE